MIRINDPSTQFDKLPPQSITAEQCLLASLMLDVDLYEEARERIHSHEAFYLVDHAIIFKILADARERGRPMDAVILREELARRGQLDEIGGTAYLAELLNTVPTAANGLHYADIVADKFRRREIIRAANEAIRSAWAPAEDLEEVERIASTLAMKAECVRDTGGSDPTVTLYQAAKASVDSMRGKKPRRLLTGLDEGDPGLNSFDAQSSFDCITGGFPFRQNTIIGGRPGSGKSAFVKDILIRLAQGGWRVGIVTIEEDRIKIGDNALAHESPVQNWKIQRDVVSECEHETLKHYAEEFKGLQFFIDDTCTTLTQVEASLRRMKRKYECDVLVVDHLHLIDYESGRKNESRNDQITVISKRIKALYRRLDVVGISVCQLNRQGEGIDNMPSLTTLREGGALEQDGDLIVFVHRRDYYRDNPAMTDGVPKDHLMELNVAKNKAGGTGVAKAYWDGDHQRVGNWNNGQGPMNDARMEADAQQALSYL